MYHHVKYTTKTIKTESKDSFYLNKDTNLKANIIYLRRDAPRDLFNLSISSLV